MTIGVWLYNDIPGTHPSFTVAVYAVGQRDADNRIKCIFGGGKRAGSVSPGNIKANCGDISDAAQKEISNEHERFLRGQS